MAQRQVETVQGPIERWRGIALIIGIVGLVLTVVGFVVNQQQFWASYLTAWFYVFGLSLAGILMSVAHYLGGGRWGAAVGDVLRSQAALFWLLGIMFIPIVIGAWFFGIYPWSHPEVYQHDPQVLARGVWMTLWFWTLRTVILWAALIVVSRYLLHWFRLWDETGDPVYRRRLRNLAGASTVIVILGVTFGFFDWTMSLEPDWYSSIYGLMLILGDVLCGWAFMVFVFTRLRFRYPVNEMMSRNLMRDLGSLMIAMTILWAYTTYSPMMLVWVGNLTQEIPWYLKRGFGEPANYAWSVLAAVWGTTNFVINFPALVMRGTRKSPIWLGGRIVVLVMIGRFLEDIWLIEPDLVQNFPIWSHWVDVAAILGLGGIWLYFFLGQLGQRLSVVRPAAIFPEHTPVYPLGPEGEPLPRPAR